MALKLYNSLSRKLEEFKPISPPEVGIYTCGPTVYSFVTIGNWRTYVLGDLLVRTLSYLGYQPKYVMNITDVGHLTGDNLGDADTGEDRLEKAAKSEGRTAWDIAKFYTEDFLNGYKKLGLIEPFIFCKATDHIPEQIEIVKEIEKKGFAYKISDGIYFDVGAYEQAGNQYGELSTLDRIKAGARVEPVPGKKDPRDFALWKFSYPKGRSFDSAQDDVASRRHMEWDSPWGVGFPGWHIECSAMSLKYLGNAFKGEQFYGERSRTIDIHLGGEDLRSTHHPNEIAQSEAATGKKPFVKYWIHGAFLLVDGGRMGKSLGNAYTLYDIKKRGFKPEHLRYFYLTGHYRQPLNFTWEGLGAAKEAVENLREKVVELPKTDVKFKGTKNEWEQRFQEVLTDDLNMPTALMVLLEMIKSDLADTDKKELIKNWDQVFGLNLAKDYEFKGKNSGINIVSDTRLSVATIAQIDDRELARKSGEWQKADEIRQTIEAGGFIIKDTNKGTAVIKK